MKEIHLHIPKDVLKSLLDEKQSNYPFNINDGGQSLRIVLWVAKPQPQKKFFPQL